jgi:hypothetical protein
MKFAFLKPEGMVTLNERSACITVWTNISIRGRPKISARAHSARAHKDRIKRSTAESQSREKSVQGLAAPHMGDFVTMRF